MCAIVIRPNDKASLKDDASLMDEANLMNDAGLSLSMWQGENNFETLPSSFFVEWCVDWLLELMFVNRIYIIDLIVDWLPELMLVSIICIIEMM